MADFAGAAVVVFARAPELGRVCTRLQESLGAEAATDIYRRLLCHRLQQLMDIPARVEVWVEGQLEHPFFAPWQSSGSFAWFQQKGADLGERMYLASCAAAGRSRWQLLIGVDSPALDAAYLAAALAALQSGKQAVLGPAEDGGYVLLGLAGISASLFFDLPWGTDRVAEITMQRLSRLGWDWARLPVLWDLDRPEDLARLDEVRLLQCD